MDADPAVDTPDIGKHGPKIGRCAVDVEVVEGRVPADVIEAVGCVRAWRRCEPSANQGHTRPARRGG